MNKALKYTLGGAAIAGCGNGLINVLSQLSDPDPNRKFDWDSLFIAFIKGVAIGGGTGFLIGTLRDKEMSDTLNAIGGISFVIEQALTDYTDDCTILNQKAAKLQRLLYNEFQDSLTEYPTIRGSIERGTAIAGSDVDIQLKFYKGAIFLDEMWNLVDCFLREKFADVHFESMREQEYSTGLFFRINGELKRIDIVCGRELDNGQGDMFIYSKRSESWRKTNAQKQGLALKFTEKQRSIVKLLKIWKKENNLKIPSVFIEHLVKPGFCRTKDCKRAGKWTYGCAGLHWF